MPLFEFFNEARAPLLSTKLLSPTPLTNALNGTEPSMLLSRLFALADIDGSASITSNTSVIHSATATDSNNEPLCTINAEYITHRRIIELVYLSIETSADAHHRATKAFQNTLQEFERHQRGDALPPTDQYPSWVVACLALLEKKLPPILTTNAQFTQEAISPCFKPDYASAEASINALKSEDAKPFLVLAAALHTFSKENDPSTLNATLLAHDETLKKIPTYPNIKAIIEQALTQETIRKTQLDILAGHENINAFASLHKANQNLEAVANVFALLAARGVGGTSTINKIEEIQNFLASLIRSVPTRANTKKDPSEKLGIYIEAAQLCVGDTRKKIIDFAFASAVATLTELLPTQLSTLKDLDDNKERHLCLLQVKQPNKQSKNIYTEHEGKNTWPLTKQLKKRLAMLEGYIAVAQNQAQPDLHWVCQALRETREFCKSFSILPKELLDAQADIPDLLNKEPHSFNHVLHSLLLSHANQAQNQDQITVLITAISKEATTAALLLADPRISETVLATKNKNIILHYFQSLCCNNNPGKISEAIVDYSLKALLQNPELSDTLIENLLRFLSQRIEEEPTTVIQQIARVHHHLQASNQPNAALRAASHLMNIGKPADQQKEHKDFDAEDAFAEAAKKDQPSFALLYNLCMKRPKNSPLNENDCLINAADIAGFFPRSSTFNDTIRGHLEGCFNAREADASNVLFWAEVAHLKNSFNINAQKELFRFVAQKTENPLRQLWEGLAQDPSNVYAQYLLFEAYLSEQEQTDELHEAEPGTLPPEFFNSYAALANVTEIKEEVDISPALAIPREARNILFSAYLPHFEDRKALLTAAPETAQKSPRKKKAPMPAAPETEENRFDSRPSDPRALSSQPNKTFVAEKRAKAKLQEKLISCHKTLTNLFNVEAGITALQEILATVRDEANDPLLPPPFHQEASRNKFIAFYTQLLPTAFAPNETCFLSHTKDSPRIKLIQAYLDQVHNGHCEFLSALVQPLQYSTDPALRFFYDFVCLSKTSPEASVVAEIASRLKNNKELDKKLADTLAHQLIWLALTTPSVRAEACDGISQYLNPKGTNNFGSSREKVALALQAIKVDTSPDKINELLAAYQAFDEKAIPPFLKQLFLLSERIIKNFGQNSPLYQSFSEFQHTLLSTKDIISWLIGPPPASISQKDHEVYTLQASIQLKQFLADNPGNTLLAVVREEAFTGYQLTFEDEAAHQAQLETYRQTRKMRKGQGLTDEAYHLLEWLLAYPPLQDEILEFINNHAGKTRDLPRDTPALSHDKQTKITAIIHKHTIALIQKAHLALGNNVIATQEAAEKAAVPLYINAIRHAPRTPEELATQARYEELLSDFMPTKENPKGPTRWIYTFIKHSDIFLEFQKSSQHNHQEIPAQTINAIMAELSGMPGQANKIREDETRIRELVHLALTYEPQQQQFMQSFRFALITPQEKEDFFKIFYHDFQSHELSDPPRKGAPSLFMAIQQIFKAFRSNPCEENLQITIGRIKDTLEKTKIQLTEKYPDFKKAIDDAYDETTPLMENQLRIYMSAVEYSARYQNALGAELGTNKSDRVIADLETLIDYSDYRLTSEEDTKPEAAAAAVAAYAFQTRAKNEDEIHREKLEQETQYLEQDDQKIKEALEQKITAEQEQFEQLLKTGTKQEPQAPHVQLSQPSVDNTKDKEPAFTKISFSPEQNQLFQSLILNAALQKAILEYIHAPSKRDPQRTNQAKTRDLPENEELSEDKKTGLEDRIKQHLPLENSLKKSDIDPIVAKVLNRYALAMRHAPRSEAQRALAEKDETELNRLVQTHFNTSINIAEAPASASNPRRSSLSLGRKSTTGPKDKGCATPEENEKVYQQIKGSDEYATLALFPASMTQEKLKDLSKNHDATEDSKNKAIERLLLETKVNPRRLAYEQGFRQTLLGGLTSENIFLMMYQNPDIQNHYNQAVKEVEKNPADFTGREANALKALGNRLDQLQLALTQHFGPARLEATKKDVLEFFEKKLSLLIQRKKVESKRTELAIRTLFSSQRSVTHEATAPTSPISSKPKNSGHLTITEQAHHKLNNWAQLPLIDRAINSLLRSQNLSEQKTLATLLTRILAQMKANQKTLSPPYFKKNIDNLMKAIGKLRISLSTRTPVLNQEKDTASAAAELPISINISPIEKEINDTLEKIYHDLVNWAGTPQNHGTPLVIIFAAEKLKAAGSISEDLKTIAKRLEEAQALQAARGETLSDETRALMAEFRKAITPIKNAMFLPTPAPAKRGIRLSEIEKSQDSAHNDQDRISISALVSHNNNRIPSASFSGPPTPKKRDSDTVFFPKL